jgi:LysW-gamma-L-lysine carboxypeptidase
MVKDKNACAMPQDKNACAMPQEDRSLDTLIGLLERYSPSGSEGDAVNWLVGHMWALGFSQSYVDEVGNAVGLMGEGDRQIVLLGHIDTVPGEIPVHIVDTEDGAVLYGRGAVDAKAPLAAFVDAVGAMGGLQGVQFVVIGAVEEERESIGARSIVDRYRPEYAIIGEPSRWNRVTLGYKGSAWAEIIVRCSMAHSAGVGETAPEIAVGLWNRIQEWAAKYNQDRTRIFDQVSPTLGGFSSSEDGFEGAATLQVGVRLPLGLESETWYAHLRTLIPEAFAEIEPKGYPIMAYKSERNSPLVRAFLGGIREASGKPGFVVKTGTADLNIVAPVWGCPAVAYGPGDSNLDHRPDEHIFLDEYQRSVLVLQCVLERLSGHVKS